MQLDDDDYRWMLEGRWMTKEVSYLKDDDSDAAVFQDSASCEYAEAVDLQKLKRRSEGFEDCEAVFVTQMSRVLKVGFILDEWMLNNLWCGRKERES